MLHLLMLAAVLASAPSPQAEDATALILRALGLPTAATEARQAGVPEVMVRGVLDLLRRGDLPASEAVVVVREETAAVKAGGSKENFGGFVRQQLDSGLRGRALADAIRAEHRARGVGRPDGRPPREGQNPDTPRGRRP